ncbi:hypothetical protein [Muriicola soli]|uniref:Exo-alpha-sialidase n=1 Tax=Muriicola soli TaxID=2507538 RepID=A0A411ED30_9FLAO|nr:hypothetical protein [Muriicola soli]QBA65407.1 hypothetical protein EQY75_13220 [Muriicola soli]
MDLNLISQTGFSIPPKELRKGSTPLWVTSNNDLIYARGLKIRLESDSGSCSYSIPKTPAEKLLGWNALCRRVLRMDISALTVLDENLIAIKKGAIVFKGRNQQNFRRVFKISRGSRPLNICHWEDRLYWGEYFSNPTRCEVHIYGSKDGEKWEKAYTFPEGRIRHVHGIYEDTFRNGMWVLTGDTDSESGIWFTGDHFQTLECVVTGSQKARAVSVIPMKKGLIVPMDSPNEINFIQKYDMYKREFSPLVQIAGSAFYRYTSPSVSLISTVVEPSEVNQARYIELYASLDLKHWTKIAELKMDFWSSLSMKLFRYPEIRFPEVSRGDPDQIYLYCSGVRGYNRKMVILDRQVLVKFLKFRSSFHNDQTSE